MSKSSSSGRSRPGGPGSARPALEALLADASGDPIRRALWLDAVDQRLRSCLPPPLAAHARLANVDGARLVFVVDAPVWHARLRLAAPGILDAARSIGLAVTELVARTTTQAPETAVRAPTPVTMSAAQQEALRLALASLADPDPGAGQ